MSINSQCEQEIVFWTQELLLQHPSYIIVTNVHAFGEPVANSSGASSISQMALRHTFVSMLFALAIAEVAIQSSNLVSIVRDSSANNSPLYFLRDVPFDGVWLMVAPISHLILVLMVICMSWVGWSHSIERGNARDVSRIFSVEFLLLLIELLLVVSYFVLARSVELVSPLSPGQQSLSAAISSPSATTEAFWLFLIFIGYCIWDFFADALPGNFPEEYGPLYDRNATLNWISIVLSGMAVRCLVSAISAAATYVVFTIAKSSNQNPLEVAVADLALLCVVIWFWTGKGLEPLLAKKLIPWERHRKGHRDFASIGASIRATVFLGPIYLFFLFLL